ncbi:MAG: phosphotransferase [Thermomicrobiales bacterium]|nr:phosphotransferase [Thermomicrobiales bacterium]
MDTALWPGALKEFRWFGEKQRTIERVASRVESIIEGDRTWIALVFLDVTFQSGADSTWFTPLVFEPKPTKPALVKITDRDDNAWFGTDAAAHPDFHAWVLASMAAGVEIGVASGGALRWNAAPEAAQLPALTGRLLSGEQSNSSIIFGDQLIVKLMRRIVPGLNPDAEIGRFLTRETNISSVPPLIADLSLRTAAGEASLGIAQRFVPNARDGWGWLLDELMRADANPARQATVIDAIHDLGASTAELHQALARATDPAMAPQPITTDDLTGWTRGTLQLMDTVGDALAQYAGSVQDRTKLGVLELALNAWAIIGASVVGHEASAGLAKIRVHGDYHLGQTLLRGKAWRIIDFEGEPARSLDERRSRYSPLKDVAGMLRSISYAKAMMVGEERGWLDEANALDDAFIEGYRGAITEPGLVPATESAFLDALKPWIVDKAMYEILYELNNRPDWLVVPIAALLRTMFQSDLGDYFAAGDAEP